LTRRDGLPVEKTHGDKLKKNVNHRKFSDFFFPEKYGKNYTGVCVNLVQTVINIRLFITDVLSLLWYHLESLAWSLALEFGP